VFDCDDESFDFEFVIRLNAAKRTHADVFEGDTLQELRIPSMYLKKKGLYCVNGLCV